MISKGKLMWFAFYPVVLLLVAGCSGINASKSVSPIDFILPGLMQADPPQQPDRTLPTAGPAQQVAKN
ncbi:MAG: hypothetical protein ACTHKU_06320 [Verrucomicrobiota bacterium]